MNSYSIEMCLELARPGGKAKQLATKMRLGKLIGTQEESARDKAVY